MPARTLLSSEQRTRLFSIPTDPPEMVRHYTLGADDLALVRTKRRPVNRVGFAVQLCLLRYPGFGLGPGEQPSEAVIAFVAHQLGAPPADFSDYAQRDQTRREHVVELQRYLCLRSFGLADWRACLRVGSEAASATDRGEPIVLTILAHLRANRVVLPSATVLERIGLAAPSCASWRRPVPGNVLSRALRALGRIEQTLFTLQWLSDPALRQRSDAGLNKGEASNALRRAVFFHRQGEIRDRTFENQSFRASGLSLITAAIVHWNTVYLDRAVRQLRAQGAAVPDDLLAHVAPLGWQHIGLTGDYVWTASDPAVPFRPLRDVRAMFPPLAA